MSLLLSNYVVVPLPQTKMRMTMALGPPILSCHSPTVVVAEKATFATATVVMQEYLSFQKAPALDEVFGDLVML